MARTLVYCAGLWMLVAVNAACGRLGYECLPLSCADLFASCDAIDDGCGGVLDCSCPLAFSCEANACVAGSGVDGDLTISSPTAFQECALLRNTSSPQEVVVEEWIHSATGRWVLLLQVQDEFAITGDQTDIGPEHVPGDSGRWHMGQVTQQASGPIPGQTVLSFAAAVGADYSTDPGRSRSAQACLVREYNNVHVVGGARWLASPWDGTTGGVFAALVRGLTLDGLIDASRAGFRGGSLRPAVGANTGALDVDPPLSGAAGGKGEGLDARAYSRSGRGNYANAGGGGNGWNAGGGGGSNGGAGGSGGLEWEGAGPDLDTPGLPGAPVIFPIGQRLVMGGGGGAGQRDNSTGSGSGGSGGGTVFVFANELRGAGTIVSTGGDGSDAPNDGAGGGGAGGTIWVVATDSSFSGTIRAVGGGGGSVVMGGGEHGPGGAGGGGRIRIDGELPGATLVVSGGRAGVEVGGGNIHRGATDGEPGVME